MLTDILRRLQGEVALVERATAAERERIAALAETWGHVTFARYLRGQPVAGPECPDCRGIGYDASGQTCGCQDKPSPCAYPNCVGGQAGTICKPSCPGGTK